MKSITNTRYEVFTSSRIIQVFEHWYEVCFWEDENSREHPDWRITNYGVRQVLTHEVIFKELRNYQNV